MRIGDLQEKYEDFYAPRFSVEVDGVVFSDRDGVISDLKIDTTMDGADQFSFSLNYQFDWENGEFVGLDWEQFAVGRPVTILMGYGSAIEAEQTGAQPATDPAFVGSIAAVKSDYPSSGTPTVQVSGFDPLKDMMSGEYDRSWEDVPMVTIVEEIASEYFDTVQIDDVGLTVTKLSQDQETDYDFLVKKIATPYGFEVFARRNTFYFKTRDPTKLPTEPILVLKYGESLGAFSPEVNQASQVQTVEVRHWDPDTKSKIVGSASQPEGSGTRIIRSQVADEEAATKRAEGELKRISQSFVGGSGETVGLPELRAGVFIGIEGVGTRFSRNYFVTQASHSIGGSGYTTTFQVAERV